MDKRCIVTVTKFAEKQIRRLPKYIKEDFLEWAHAVEEEGIRRIRMLPGYHDEPLRGDRIGQRSVRLTRAYRVIYEESDRGELIIIAVQEVTHHEY